MKNPKVWGHQAEYEAETQRSFYAGAFPIGRIFRFEAEDYDHGDNGTAYFKKTKALAENIYRKSFVEIIPANDIPGGYNLGAGDGFCITGMSSGEWTEYTIIIEKAGYYDISVRAASKSEGGTISLNFDSGSNSGGLAVPCTGGRTSWANITFRNILLKEGKQVMRFSVGGRDDFEGSFNYFEFLSMGYNGI